LRILHTSDWHLGRNIATFDLSNAQADAVQFIVDEAIKRKVDVFIIAGDVYDQGRPAVAEINLLNTALTRLNNAGITVIVTAGNHDEAERLAANSNLMKENVHIWGSIEDSGKSIVVEDEHGPVAFYPLTYLKPFASREIFNERGANIEKASHQEVVSQAMTYVREDITRLEAEFGRKVRSVVVAHAFVTTHGSKSTDDVGDENQLDGITRSQSERDLSVGGIQNASSELFDGISYVALGHIHGPQKVKAKTPATAIRYSGSLLKYSLSEATHKKSFVLLQLGSSQAVKDEDVELVLIPQPRGMARLIGEVDKLTGGEFAVNKNDFVDIIVTDAKYSESLQAKVRNYFPFMMSFAHKPARGEGGKSASEDIRGRQLSEIDIIKGFFSKVTGADLSKVELEVVQSTLEEVNAGLDSDK
jgi:exonuclease SbcD